MAPTTAITLVTPVEEAAPLRTQVLAVCDGRAVQTRVTWLGDADASVGVLADVAEDAA